MEFNMDPGTVVNIDAIIWLAVMVVFFIIEGMTYALICVWFAGGAIAALIMSLIGFNMLISSTVFVIVSAILLLLLRPTAIRLTAGRKTRTNADRVIGQEGIVIVRIDPIKGEGQIKVIGQTWSAKPEDGSSVFEPDQRVEVVGITGVKAIVKEKIP
jgi:membrane protein implicated in regulation of membrane protease activity